MASAFDWQSIKTIKDPNHAINVLINKIKECQDKATCITKKNIHKNNLCPRSDWITTAIMKSCQNKEYLYNKMKKEPKNNQIKETYKNYVKILNKVIKNAKINYEKHRIKANINNARQLWKIINSKIGKKVKSNNNSINKIAKENNEILTEPNDIANYMNNYFCNIGEKISDSIKINKNKNISLPTSNKNSIFLRPTNAMEVQTVIKNMKNKNGGVDTIHAKSIKTISILMSDTLAYIYNQCIEQSVWPDALKISEIVPIYKAGSKMDVANYRPISLISNLAKILERLIYNRLYDFICKHRILSRKQFGFVKNRGTKEVLSMMTNKLYENLDKSKPIAITFLDLAKAFDTVNHTILLKKLYNYGIRGNAYKLLENYLQNRYQKVRIDQHESERSNVKSGVPQGTILGPLLFILYVNDLLTMMPDSTTFSYADDTAVLAEGTTWKDVECNMNDYLDKIDDWLALNRLSLNVKKTVYITFGNYCDSVPKDIDIRIKNYVLQRVEECKYLGINFDYNLKWDSHTQYIVKKTKYLIFVFYKIAKYMETGTMRIIYFALFHSIMNYGIIAWGGAYNNSTEVLQRVQNRILKIINKNSFIQNHPMNIKQLFAYTSLISNYSTLKELYLNSNSITRKKSIAVPKRNKTVSEKSNYITSIKIFNGLPNDMKTLDLTKISAKEKLKRWIKEGYLINFV